MDVLAVIGEIVLYSVGVFFVFIMMMVGLVVVMEFISKNTNDTKTIIIRINTITNKVKDIMPSFFSKIVQYVQKPTLITKKVFNISHLLSKNIIVHIKELRKSILPNTGKICIAILIFSVAYKIIFLSDDIYARISSLSASSIYDLIKELRKNFGISELEIIKTKFSELIDTISFLFGCVIISYIFMYAKINEYKAKIEELYRYSNNTDGTLTEKKSKINKTIRKPTKIKKA